MYNVHILILLNVSGDAWCKERLWSVEDCGHSVDHRTGSVSVFSPAGLTRTGGNCDQTLTGDHM